MRYHRDRGVLHLELHTGDVTEVRLFLWQLLGWQSREVGTGGGGYLALSVGGRVGGGIVGCAQRPASWLPYIGVGNAKENFVIDTFRDHGDRRGHRQPARRHPRAAVTARALCLRHDPAARWLPEGPAVWCPVGFD